TPRTRRSSCTPRPSTRSANSTGSKLSPVSTVRTSTAFRATPTRSRWSASPGPCPTRCPSATASACRSGRARTWRGRSLRRPSKRSSIGETDDGVLRRPFPLPSPRLRLVPRRPDCLAEHPRIRVGAQQIKRVEHERPPLRGQCGKPIGHVEVQVRANRRAGEAQLPEHFASMHALAEDAGNYVALRLDDGRYAFYEHQRMFRVAGHT